MSSSLSESSTTIIIRGGEFEYCSIWSKSSLFVWDFIVAVDHSGEDADQLEDYEDDDDLEDEEDNDELKDEDDDDDLEENILETRKY